MNLVNFNVAGETNTKYNFTEDQAKAIDGIINFIAQPFDSAKFIIGLTGAGGTGKTFITNYIINNCKYANSVIRCTSPTHKACRVFSQAIGGKQVFTIQSTFGLRLDLKLEDFDPKNPQFNPAGTPKLDEIKLLIVDECTMIPTKLVTYICNYCKSAQIKILFLGDIYQLAPVNEKKSIAFDRCFQIFKLNQLVRQNDDNPIVSLLHMLRQDIDNRSFNFIQYVLKHIGETNYNQVGEGYTIVSPQQFKSVIDLSFNDEEYQTDIDLLRVIGYTNACVSGWNNYIRNSIIKDADKNIITRNDLIMSYETIVNDFLEPVINNSEEYIVNDIVNYTDETYGFKGFLVKFQMIHGGKIAKPLFVIDHKDKFTILKYHKVISELVLSAKSANGGTRATKWKDYYKFRKKYLLATNITDKYDPKRVIYPRDIDYGFAITSHKSQGSTYKTVFVDVNDMIYDKHGRPYNEIDELLRRLYVACSRASKELILCVGR